MSGRSTMVLRGHGCTAFVCGTKSSKDSDKSVPACQATLEAAARMDLPPVGAGNKEIADSPRRFVEWALGSMAQEDIQVGLMRPNDLMRHKKLCAHIAAKNRKIAWTWIVMRANHPKRRRCCMGREQDRSRVRMCVRKGNGPGPWPFAGDSGDGLRGPGRDRTPGRGGGGGHGDRSGAWGLGRCG
jgi:hypothetical protein